MFDLTRTKLRRPTTINSLLTRPRLFEQLRSSLVNPLTLVSSPAGFGKTTLISAWIEELTAAHSEPDLPVKFAWLSLDKGDSDLTRFLRYFIAAIRTPFPDSCALISDMVNSHVRSLDELITVLCNELLLLPAHLILVLDDYHVIDNEAVHELLNTVIRHFPQHMHLIVISRNSPPFSLANLRAKGLLTEIRSYDLRFTTEESAKFLLEVRCLPISSDAVAVLQQRIEGWIVGLHLAALSLSMQSDIESAVMNLAGSDAYIADYLVDEVLLQQPPRIQKFLLITSILDRFCAGLCEVVVADSEREDDISACIDWVQRASLFVKPLDSGNMWFSYHALFRELLQHRLTRAMKPGELNDKYRHAAIWCAQEGLIEEALHYAITAHDFDLAARVMEQGLCEVLNREDRLTLERWLRLLPDEIIARSPGLLMIRAWVFQLTWQVDAQVKVLRQAEVLIDNAMDGTFSIEEINILRGQIATMDGQAAYLHNDPARAVALCQEALSCLPNSWLYVRGGALIYLSRGMQAMGRSHDAVRLLLDSYETITVRTTSYALRHLMILCDIYVRDGQLEKASHVARSMLPVAIQSRLTIQETWAHYFLGVVAYERNELDAACEHFEAVVEMRYITQIKLVDESFFGLVLIKQARGERLAARQTMEQLREFSLETSVNDDARTNPLFARLLLLQGDLEGASRWADAFTASPQEQPLLWLEPPLLTKARILLAKGNDEDVLNALHMIDTIYEIAIRGFNVNFQINILSLRALALDRVGGENDHEALVALRQAVELARQGGYIRLFVDFGLPMKSLLERIARQGFATETIRSIIAAFPGSQLNAHVYNVKAAYDAPVLALDEHLTARELDVLMLLSNRSSNKEIASQLGISTVTVKRHVANIYGKLGVNRRWDAVIKAETIGLLSPP